MKFGFVMFPTREAIPPDAFARLLEDRGFESLFYPDHTHVPARTPEMYDVASLPPEFAAGMDPFVALGVAATVTTTLRLGTAVALVTERDHFATAKAVATLDVLSGGRMHFGIGPGWIYQELRDHGVRPEARFRLQREKVEAMKQLWTEEAADYHGEFISFSHARSWPKPVTTPHPPILVAGNGPRVAERVVAYGDEWIPMLRPGVLQQIAHFKRVVRKPGSDEPIPVTLFGADVEDVEAYRRAGVDRVLFWPRPDITAKITGLVDRTARALGRYLA